MVAGRERQPSDGPRLRFCDIVKEKNQYLKKVKFLTQITNASLVLS